MGWMHRMIRRLAGRAAETTRGITVRRTAIGGVVMAKVIEFYMPKTFRKPTKRVPAEDRGKIIEFRPQTRKSA